MEQLSTKTVTVDQGFFTLKNFTFNTVESQNSDIFVLSRKCHYLTFCFYLGCHYCEALQYSIYYSLFWKNEEYDGKPIRNALGSPEINLTRSSVPLRVSNMMKVSFVLDYENLDGDFVTADMTRKAKTDAFSKKVLNQILMSRQGKIHDL